MDIKFNWKVILALAAIVIFVFEIIAMGFIGNPFTGGNSNTGTTIVGVAQFNGTLRTYDPMLIVPLGTSEEVLGEVRELNGVTDVTTSQDSILIYTETRDDVYPIAMFLKEKNVTSYAIANVAMPSYVKVTLENGSETEAGSMSGAVRFVTEPIIDVDNEVGIIMIVELSNGIIINYDRASIAAEEKTINIDASVVKLDYIYTYTIPWEERNNVSVEGNYTYERKDYIVFSEPLDRDQIMARKNLSYVIYIDEYSIECAENFTDIARLKADFGENVVLPDSVLKITSVEEVPLAYEKTTTYYYTLSIPEKAGGVSFGKNEIGLEIDRLYEVNSTVELEITGVVIGADMVTINSIEPA